MSELVPAVGTERYLWLLRRCLTGMLQADPSLEVAPRRSGATALARRLRRRLGAGPRPRLQPFDAERRRSGRDWPATADTMIGLRRLENVDALLRRCLADEVPGGFLEAGIWRGGTCIYARALLDALGAPDRLVWLADSFRGLPPPDGRHAADARSGGHRWDELAVGKDEVRRRFRRYGLDPDAASVRWLVGWFADTLPGFPAAERLAVLRCDGDLYGSTWDTLTLLYPHVAPSGFVIMDDYGVVATARRATDDFRRELGVTVPLVDIDGAGVYWRKP